MKKMNVKGSTLKRVLKAVGKRKVLLVLTLICALIYVVSSVIIPVFVGNAIDLAIGKGNVDLAGIGVILLKIAGCAAAAGIAQYLMNLCLSFAKKQYKKCYLETFNNMIAANRFYQKNQCFH